MSAAELDRDSVAALADDPVDWRFKGLPPTWAGHTPAQVCAEMPVLFDDEPTGPVCVLSADALTHNLTTMADWCCEAGVKIAPHGKTHMAPQLFARQFDAGACGITVATISQARVCRAFGVRDLILANELVDAGGLRWLAAELDRDPELGFVCWVDSVRGVEAMAAALTGRPVDVCVEVGIPGGRTGCRTQGAVDEVAQAVVDCPRLRLVGVAGYEAALGHDVSDDALATVAAFLREMRSAVERLQFETDDVVVTAGGSTYFDLVADILAGDWRTVIRSGAYLTHDHGVYERTSPLTRGGKHGLRPAMTVWAQVSSIPEPGLALVTMGRRDVSFDQDLPVPLALPDSRVTRLNDQHTYIQLGSADRVDVGTWLEFGISHPCTVFDKWQLLPVLDGDGRVVELVRTFF